MPFYHARCGSVVDLALKFNSTVRESEVLSLLRDAAEKGMFGNVNVIATSIVGMRSERAKTATTATPTSSSDSKLP